MSRTSGWDKSSRDQKLRRLVHGEYRAQAITPSPARLGYGVTTLTGAAGSGLPTFRGEGNRVNSLTPICKPRPISSMGLIGGSLSRSVNSSLKCYGTCGVGLLCLNGRLGLFLYFPLGGQSRFRRKAFSFIHGHAFGIIQNARRGGQVGFLFRHDIQPSSRQPSPSVR
jgi:hypothetical protein